MKNKIQIFETITKKIPFKRLKQININIKFIFKKYFYILISDNNNYYYIYKLKIKVNNFIKKIY